MAGPGGQRVLAPGSSVPGVTREGWLGKRYFRVNRWSERYFVLKGSTLYYFPMREWQTAREPRGQFTLRRGCCVGDVVEIPTPKNLKRVSDKVYSFTIVWCLEPRKEKSAAGDRAGSEGGGGHPPHGGNTSDHEMSAEENEDSSGEGAGHVGDQAPSAQHNIGIPTFLPRAGGPLDETGIRAATQASFVKSHINASRAIDVAKARHAQAMRRGAVVASVAVGGMLVGGFTAGLGLIAYLAIVGAASAVGGGTYAYQSAAAMENRLVLTARTREDAEAWKLAIEAEVAQCEGRRPAPPLGVDLDLVQDWMDLKGSKWCVERVLHGLRVLREIPRSPRVRRGTMHSTTARKVQVSVQATPLEVFLTVMAGLSGRRLQTDLASTAASPYGPGGAPTVAHEDWRSSLVPCTVLGRVVESARVVDKLDEHTDVLHLTFRPVKSRGRRGCMAGEGGTRVHDPEVPWIVRWCGQALEWICGADTRLLELTVTRYWRLDEDGSFIIYLMSGVGDASVGHQRGRARSQEGGMETVFIVSPRCDYTRHTDDVADCRLTCIARLEADHRRPRPESSTARLGRTASILLLLLPWRWTTLAWLAKDWVDRRRQVALYCHWLSAVVDVKDVVEQATAVMPGYLMAGAQLLAQAVTASSTSDAPAGGWTAASKSQHISPGSSSISKPHRSLSPRHRGSREDTHSVNTEALVLLEAVQDKEKEVQALELDIQSGKLDRVFYEEQQHGSTGQSTAPSIANAKRRQLLVLQSKLSELSELQARYRRAVEGPGRPSSSRWRRLKGRRFSDPKKSRSPDAPRLQSKADIAQFPLAKLQSSLGDLPRHWSAEWGPGKRKGHGPKHRIGSRLHRVVQRTAALVWLLVASAMVVVCLILMAQTQGSLQALRESVGPMLSPLLAPFMGQVALAAEGAVPWPDSVHNTIIDEAIQSVPPESHQAVLGQDQGVF